MTLSLLFFGGVPLGESAKFCLRSGVAPEMLVCKGFYFRGKIMWNISLV